MADYLNIAGRVRTTASDGVAMEAQEVKDINQNKSQQEINADVQTELGDRYTKEETYSKEQLDELITTPDVNYVSVVATDATTAVTDILPATGEANTIYRVGNWNGTQYDPTMYALYAWNGSAYVCLAVRSFVGEVYDISVYHPDGQGNPTPYADLAAALGTNGANIPADIRRGGMSVKFIQGSVQSSDNKYVQYRLMATSWSTTVTDWQGVDEEPTAGSNNLVKSGGVSKIQSEIDNIIGTPSDIADDVIVAQTGAYIKYSGGTVGDSVYYKITEPIELKAGETIQVEARAGSSVSAISLYTGSTTKYTPLVQGNGVNTYVYTTLKDCQVVLSYMDIFKKVQKTSTKNIIKRLKDNIDEGIYDVSLSNLTDGNPTSYDTLSAALAATPDNKRKGGIIIKFIQLTLATYTVVKTEGLTEQPTGTEVQEALSLNSGTYTAAQMSGVTPPESGSVTYYLAVTVDETTTYTTWVITKATSDMQKYVQYRLMSTAWSNVIGDWQGVEDVLVSGSKNLATSGCIFKSTREIEVITNKLSDNSTLVETSNQETGAFVRFSNGTVDTSSVYAISEPIQLLEGQRLMVYAKAVDLVSVISLTNEQGTSYTPKVRGRNIDWYEYLATENCYVAISYNISTPLEVNILSGNLDVKVKNLKEEIEEGIEEVEDEIKKIEGTSEPVTLSDQEIGAYVRFPNGSVATSVVYAISEPIQLLEGQRIRVYAKAVDLVSVISLTNEQGTSYTPKVRGRNIDWYEYLATEDCYVAISYNISTPNKVNILSLGGYIAELQNDIDNALNNNIISAFDNIVCVGDSLTYSHVYTSNNGGRQAYNPWPKVVKKICGLDEYSIFARSGGTSKTIWERYKNSFAIPASGKTICFIYLGTNNWFEDTLDTSAPEADVATYETSWADDFTGSMCKIIQKFINFGAKICIIRPRAGGVGGDSPEGWTLADTNAVLLKIINRFNCAYLDSSKMHSADLKYHYYPDLSGSNSVHYNDLGYAFFASCLIKEIGKMGTEYMKRIIPT